MYCNNCGNLLKDGSKFCNKCGEKVPNNSQGIENSENESKTPRTASKISDKNELKTIPVAKKISIISEPPLQAGRKFSIVYLWILSIIGFLLAFISIFSNFFSGIFLLLSALIIFPPVREKYVKKFPIRLRYALIISFILLLIGFNISEPTKIEEKESYINNQKKSETEINNTEEKSEVSDEQGVETIAQFTGSSFFKRYNFYDMGPYTLKNGDLNNPFGTDEFGEGLTSIDVVTKKGVISDIGVSFYSRDSVIEEEFTFIESFIVLFSGVNEVDAAMSFVRKNIKIGVKDDNTSISETNPYKWEGFLIRAAKIGYSSYVFSMDKE